MLQYPLGLLRLFSLLDGLTWIVLSYISFIHNKLLGNEMSVRIPGMTHGIVFTLFLIFGIRFLGVKQPDAFNEIFRQSDIESQGDSYTMESEYDTPVVDRR